MPAPPKAKAIRPGGGNDEEGVHAKAQSRRKAQRWCAEPEAQESLDGCGNGIAANEKRLRRVHKLFAPSCSFAPLREPFSTLFDESIALKDLLILIARGWQLGPSRILPPTCRYAPSCSQYAIEALGKYGAIKGGWLAVKRILRCQPWGGHGHDPVP